MKRIGFLLLIILNCWSCQDEEGERVDRDLLVYINTFEEEASKRGLEINIEQLDVTAHIINIRERNVLGQCFTYADDAREIVIDEYYWKDLSHLEKEYLMMHELGHCVLDRAHLEDSDQNGTCISIMQSGTGACEMRYNQSNRNELLDELFNI